MDQQYGYVRVSAREQNEGQQMAAMQRFGLTEKQIVVEKQSEKNFERPKYQRLLKKIKPGDTLVIKSIDRLGRNYDEILDQWQLITKQKQADIIVLDMPLLDTRQGRDLTGALISDIVLQLLSHVAQTEREFIRQRQAEGIEAARAKGIRFGRPRLDRPQAFEALRVQWMQGNISSRKAAAQLGISYQTFLRWAKEKTEPAEESPEPAEESPEPAEESPETVLKEEVM
ncbi:MAG: recombinase family protein [Oscillospiraceae bacterium]|nr:recombinase family protein [Oscillospiraceae bacterium]MDY3217851.1 recombinase family protein [Candidatus Fimivivens sp.]